MARSCRLALLGLALSTLGAIRAHADEPPPVRVVYRAPAECPTREEFEARVLARTGRAGLYPEGGAPFELFEIDLTPAPERTRGRLTTHLRGASPTVREIQAASCREAVDGLALIVALTLDPTTATATKPSTKPSGSTNGTASTPGGASGKSGTGARTGRGGGEAGGAADRTQGRRDEGSTDADEDSESDEDDLLEGDEPGAGSGSSSGRGSARFDVLLTAGAAAGVTPSLLPEGGISLGAVFPSLIEPGLMVRLGGRYAPEQTTVTTQGDATFGMWTVHAALCPQVFELSLLWVAPCANVEYGKIAASGARTLNEASSNQDWLALGPKLIGQLSFLPQLFVHVGAELDFPLFRDRYVLGPVEVHETPPLIGRLELGLGARL